MKIYLDFDGTVVEHRFPDMGKYNPGCFEVIQKLQAAGHEIILNTYRANIDLEFVVRALDFINASDLVTPITKYERRKIRPRPWNWKYFKEKNLIFIDDICKGIPTLKATSGEYDPVDWKKVDKELEANGIYGD